MSEENVTKNEAVKREPYTFSDLNLEFVPDEASKYMTSKEFAEEVTNLFKQLFGDWYGAKFLVTQTGVPMINLYFQHVDPNSPHTAPLACTLSADKSTGATVIDRNRRRDFQRTDGDRYWLTDDGKDVIKHMLYSNYYNGGKVEWKKIMNEITERTSSSFYAPNGIQLTEITGIDPARVASRIWGKKDSEGSDIDYMVQVVKNLSANPTYFGMQQNPIYVIRLSKAYGSNLTETYRRLGLGEAGSGISR